MCDRVGVTYKLSDGRAVLRDVVGDIGEARDPDAVRAL